ncbi:MAG: pseudouridine synthase [Bacteroidota bacterium]
MQEKYAQIFTVHRLDRDTSGVIVFAKNEETHKHLSRQFEERPKVSFYCLVLKKVGLCIFQPAVFYHLRSLL